MPTRKTTDQGPGDRRGDDAPDTSDLNYARFDTYEAWLSDNLEALGAIYLSEIPESAEDCRGAAEAQVEFLIGQTYAKRPGVDSGFQRYCWSTFCNADAQAQAYARDVRDAKDDLQYLRSQSHHW